MRTKTIRVCEVSDFLTFLRDQNCVDRYFRNLLGNPRISVQKVLDHVKSLRVEDLIAMAFYWDNTAEGSDFWTNISHKWVRFLELNNIDPHSDLAW